MSRNEISSLIKALSDELCISFPDIPGLSRKSVRELAGGPLKEVFLKPAGGTLCRSVLDALLPLLNTSFTIPQGDPLKQVYDHIASRMFPEADMPDEPFPDDAARLYLTILRRRLLYERSLEKAADVFSDIDFVTEEEQAKSRVSGEYALLRDAISGQFFFELMRIGREITPYDPLAHTAGVHNLALHIARGAKAAGIPVDIALVSASSMCHDIGKFGCRGNDASRVPYLHYYYTDRWLRRNGMPEIAHIAANHSTWDLELENLSAESLILIYADFRVRGTGTDASGRELTRICTLDEAYELILSKLYNVDEEKLRRYRRVFLKLRDFENYLIAMGADTLGSGPASVRMLRKNVSVASPSEAVLELRLSTVEHNIRLMHSISSEESFSFLLESARSEKNLYRIRTYLHLFDEYFTYMTRNSKLRLLSFLYELLMHPESDIRRLSGQLMGRVLANSGLRFRKELPRNAPESDIAPALNEMLNESASIWKDHLHLLIEPDRRISSKHRVRILNSLKVVLKSLLNSCGNEDIRSYLDPFLSLFFEKNAIYDRFVLTDSLSNIPFSLLPEQECPGLIRFAGELIRNGDLKEKVSALRLLTAFKKEFGSRFDKELLSAVSGIDGETEPAVVYAGNRLYASLCPSGTDPVRDTRALKADEISELFLENLKNAVHWTVKINNIDRLTEQLEENAGERFHVAAHLANLLLVSEHLPVREYAADALIKIAPTLTAVLCNEIVVDLVRSLKTGQYEFIRYVSPCLGKLLLLLPPKELEESVDELEGMIRSSNARAASAAVRTLSEYATGSCSFGSPDDAVLNGSRMRVLGLLLTGLAHYDETVRLETESVIGGSLFAAELLTPEAKSFLFGQIHKKFLVLLYEQPESRLTLFNTAATLNRIYRYVTEREVSREPFEFAPQGAAAFFPGTFDPFSSGHKRIVSEIRALGAEVYLAVDEFSWSKKTQPTLIRRQIVNMSTADQFGVYLFPGDIPVNLSNPGDLARLRGLFPERQLYIVVGSDVIQNASAYADPSVPGSVCDYDHIVFMRAADESDRQETLPENRIRGKVTALSLPPFYEDVSSTRIRENIDKNLDISMMVDPMVQEYIYLNSLYVRAPQYKTTVDPKAPEFINAGGIRGTPMSGYISLLKKMGVKLDPERDNRAVISGSPDGPDFGFAVSHTVNTGRLFEELSDISAAQNLRQKISGKILVIDRVYSGSADDTAKALLVNELISQSLNDDHTYAMVRCIEDDALQKVFERKGFKPLPGGDGVLIADMRSPMIFIEDALQTIKEPLCFDQAVVDMVRSCRVKLQNALTELFPGRLVLSFDSGALNRMLIKKIMEYNGAADLPVYTKNVGKYMCVPYGKILSDSVVPHTVTKTLHVEKVFERDISDFSIMEYPGYSPIAAQIETIASFGRPVILVDDLLHKGYRLEKLDSMLKSSSVEIKKIMVGILSGRGRDLMELTGRDADCVYFIPNLSYWFTESLEYPFIGGDSIKGGSPAPGYLLPSVNLILPYKMPDYIKNASPRSLYRLSLCSLENALDILQTLERRHQALFERSLTLGRLGEALHRPRIPDKGSAMKYDPGILPSQYVEDDIKLLLRIGGTER